MRAPVPCDLKGSSAPPERNPDPRPRQTHLQVGQKVPHPPPPTGGRTPRRRCKGFSSGVPCHPSGTPGPPVPRGKNTCCRLTLDCSLPIGRSMGRGLLWPHYRVALDPVHKPARPANRKQEGRRHTCIGHESVVVTLPGHCGFHNSQVRAPIRALVSPGSGDALIRSPARHTHSMDHCSPQTSTAPGFLRNADFGKKLKERFIPLRAGFLVITT